MTIRSPDRRQILQGLMAAPLLLPSAARASAGPRVACLDYSMAETLVAMGHPPIAIVDRPSYDVWVREPALPESVLDLGSRFEPNMERLSALAPDLIFSIPYNAALNPMAERVAKTLVFDIYNPDGRCLERATQATREAADAIGDPQAGERLIADVDAVFQSILRELAPRNIPPVFVISLMDARHVRVYGRMGPFQQVMDRIGVRNAWQGETNFWGFATVGLEALAGLEPAQMVVVEPLPEGVGPDVLQGPLWGRLPSFASYTPRLMEPVLMFGALPSARRFATLLRDALVSEAGAG